MLSTRNTLKKKKSKNKIEKQIPKTKIYQKKAKNVILKCEKMVVMKTTQ